jgi:hypothetical protein
VALGESVYVIGGRVCRREGDAAEAGGYRDTDVGVRADVLRYDAHRGEWRRSWPRASTSRARRVGAWSARPAAYDSEKDRWSALPNMSTRRYKCVGVTWLGSFHVVGGFAESTLLPTVGGAAPVNTVLQSSALEQSCSTARGGRGRSSPECGSSTCRRTRSWRWRTGCSPPQQLEGPRRGLRRRAQHLEHHGPLCLAGSFTTTHQPAATSAAALPHHDRRRHEALLPRRLSDALGR